MGKLAPPRAQVDIEIDSAVALAARVELAIDSSVSLAAQVCIGVVTAIVSTYAKLPLGIAGHAIIMTVAPTVLGVAMFPRRFGGSTIAGAALLTGLALRFGDGAAVGPAALTAFAMTGVLVDVVLGRRWNGFALYAALVAAGLANVAAFGAHVGEAAVLGVVTGGKSWLVQVASYAACGAAAGALSAALAFQLRPKQAA